MKITNVVTPPWLAGPPMGTLAHVTRQLDSILLTWRDEDQQEHSCDLDERTADTLEQDHAAQLPPRGRCGRTQRERQGEPVLEPVGGAA
jgi:hypothetical protein